MSILSPHEIITPGAEDTLGLGDVPVRANGLDGIDDNIIAAFVILNSFKLWVPSGHWTYNVRTLYVQFRIALMDVQCTYIVCTV